MYGHARRDRNGGLWLQYWLFYYYNDFQLVGSLLSRRQARGRLGARPDPARRERAPRAGRRTPSTSSARRQPWIKVAKHGGTRRSCTSRAARTPTTSAPARTGPATGSTAPTARARRSTPKLEIVGSDTPKWLHWPGRWGDTKAEGPLDSNSPTSPGVAPALDGPARADPEGHADQAGARAAAAEDDGGPHAPTRTSSSSRRRRRRRPSSSPRARAAATSRPRRTRSRSTRPRGRSKSPRRAKTTKSGQVLWLRARRLHNLPSHLHVDCADVRGSAAVLARHAVGGRRGDGPPGCRPPGHQGRRVPGAPQRDRRLGARVDARQRTAPDRVHGRRERGLAARLRRAGPQARALRRQGVPGGEGRRRAARPTACPSSPR